MPDQLQLRGGTTTEHNSFTGALREVTVDTTKKTLVVHDGATAGGTALMKESGGTAATTVQLGTGGVERFKITNGEVVFNETSTDTDFRIEGNGEANLFKVDAGNDRIGIGTTPAFKLHVGGSGQQDILIGSTNAGGARLILDGDSNGDGSGGDFAEIMNTTGGDLSINARNSSSDAVITFSNNGSERMRIDSSGRLLVGATTNNSASARAILEDLLMMVVQAKV